MHCHCPEPGHCALFNRVMSERNHAICQGTVLTPEKCEAYRANWAQLAGVQLDAGFCLHRGREPLRVATCNVCGRRGEQVPIYSCSLFGECSLDRHQVGQAEHVCRGCDSFVGTLQAKWDRQIKQLIPSPTQQNFNNSLIEWRGRRIMAYRHNWGGARIGLCELDREWQVKWNCLLGFPEHPYNVYQEDPRLFIHRDELHVAFTAVQTRAKGEAKLVAHVGYARLKEAAPSTWHVAEAYVPEYEHRGPWEKNWGFFSCEGQLWAVYNSERHTVLAIDRGKATKAYEHERRTIPGTQARGCIRGGASPQYWRGEFYSFVHFRRPPKNYAGGLYTFDAAPPFAPVRYLPFALLQPSPEHCTNAHAADVVYPAGAALLDWRWVISYGAYDRDSRLVAYDVNEVEACLRTP